jgi:hypothetical protein
MKWITRSDIKVDRVACPWPIPRTFFSGITNLTRNVCWAIGSYLAGLFMQGYSSLRSSPCRRRHEDHL